MTKKVLLSIASIFFLGLIFAGTNLLLFKDKILKDSLIEGNALLMQCALIVGSNPNEVYLDQELPLTYLANNDEKNKIQETLELMKLLLDYDADINKKDKNGKTPLIVSIGYNGKDEITKFLLEQNANPNIYDDKNVSPLIKSITVAKDLRIVSLLLSHGAKVSTENSMQLFQACFYKILLLEDLLELLIQNGLDVNKADDFKYIPSINSENKSNYDENGTGWSMLMNVTFIPEEKQENIILKLLDAGANINYQDAYGNTALHFALSKGSYKSTKLLLNNGSNLYIKNYDGENAMHIVLISKRYDTREKKILINDLIEAGFEFQSKIDLQNYINLAEKVADDELIDFLKAL